MIILDYIPTAELCLLEEIHDAFAYYLLYAAADCCKLGCPLHFINL